MKKLLILLLIPTFVLGAFVISEISAFNAPDYEIELGNTLSDTVIDINDYVETLEKEEIEYDITIPDRFVKKADIDGLELYVEPETLAIAVRVKENGYVYSSYAINDNFDSVNEAKKNPILSGVSLNLFIEGTPKTVSYLDKITISGNDVAVATSTITDEADGRGFKARVDFNHEYIQIKFDMYVRIEEGSLVVSVPNDSIAEYNANLWSNESGVTYYILKDIVPYQYFGSTESEDDGYVMIPDGSGALISLEDDPDTKTYLALDIYGEDLGYMSPSQRDRAFTLKDTKRLTMPMYGMIHNTSNTGFYAVIESGEPYATFNFRSAGLINDYYSSYFNFSYRQSYEQYQSRSNEDQYRISFQDYVNEFDLKVRYNFLSRSEADYVGMAKSYRDYLVGNGDLTTSARENYTEVPTKVDFIGQEVTQGILSLISTEITSYDEVVAVVKELQEDGYTELLTSLKTYNLDEMGYRFGIYRKLGGRADFNAMIDFFNTEDIAFSYYLDYVRSQKDYSRGHAQTLSKREIYHLELSSMFAYHLVNDASRYLGYAENDVADLQKYNIENVALAGLDRSLYTSWDDRIKYAFENQNEILAMLDYYEQNDIKTGVYNPDAYLFRYVSNYYDAPISSSDYSFVDASIPFVQLVLSGYVDMYSSHLNFASDEQFTLMRLVEYGIFPSYVLTGGSTYDLKRTNSSNVYISEYDVLKTRMDSYSEFYNEGLQVAIQNEMIDHTFVDEGIVLVEYLDGTQILLNYNSDAYTLGDLTVEALSYVVIS